MATKKPTTRDSKLTAVLSVVAIVLALVLLLVINSGVYSIERTLEEVQREAVIARCNAEITNHALHSYARGERPEISNSHCYIWR